MRTLESVFVSLRPLAQALPLLPVRMKLCPPQVLPVLQKHGLMDEASNRRPYYNDEKIRASSNLSRLARYSSWIAETMSGRGTRIHLPSVFIV